MEIIINADDFGISCEVNDAITYCFLHGLIQKTSLMVNMSYVDEAVLLAKKHGFDHCLGLHINLAEGRPLTKKIKETSLCDNNGLFNGSIMYGKKRFFLNLEETMAVKQEIQAQIEKYNSYGCPLNHIDSHRHAHTNFPVLNIITNTMKTIDNCTIRLSRNIPKDAMYGIKGLYKGLVNKKIKKFNARMKETMSTDYFGSIEDFNRFEAEKDLKDLRIEIMIHPVMLDNSLADLINEYSVEEWMRGKNGKIAQYSDSNKK